MLTGDLINLRALERDDLERCWTWINDAEVTQFLAVTHMPTSRAEEEKWLEKAMTRRGDECTFAITTKDGAHIGNCGLFRLDRVARHAELGIMIGDKNYWNQGYGADVVRVLVRYAFEVLNLNRVYLRVHEYNPRGIRYVRRSLVIYKSYAVAVMWATASLWELLDAPRLSVQPITHRCHPRVILSDTPLPRNPYLMNLISPSARRAGGRVRCPACRRRSPCAGRREGCRPDRVAACARG